MEGVEVVRLAVTDKDERHSPAWHAVYSFVQGNGGELFSISTDPKTNEGIVKTAKVGTNISTLMHKLICECPCVVCAHPPTCKEAGGMLAGELTSTHSKLPRLKKTDLAIAEVTG